MKQILIDLDERCARDLERVAPARKRLRAEFVRKAIRHAIDLALDRATDEAYRRQPIGDGVSGADLEGWDPENELARPAARKRGSRQRVARRVPRG